MYNRLAPTSINALQQTSAARAGPNTPAWWSDTNASWDPETGLDIYGNYGGPIGTSGPYNYGGGDRGAAANIATGWGFMNPNGPTPQQFPVDLYASETYGGQGYASPGYVQGYNSSNYARPGMSTYSPSQRLSSYFGENNSFTPNYGANMNSRF